MQPIKTQRSLPVRLVMLLVVALGLFSCSQRNVDYARAIPSDAEAVVALELKSLYKKSNLDADNLPAPLAEIFASDTSVLELMRDGKSFGIAVDHPVYLFFPPAQEAEVAPQDSTATDAQLLVDSAMVIDSIVAIEVEASASVDSLIELETVYEPSTQENVALVAKVSDRAKLEEALTKAGLSSEPSGSEDYTLYRLDGGYVAVDDERLLIANDEALLSELRARTKEASILSTKGFEKMEALGGDIRGLISLRLLTSNALATAGGLSPATNPLLQSSAYIEQFDLSKVYWIGGVSFEAGKVVANVVLHSDDKAYDETLDKAGLALLPTEGRFDQFFSKESFFMASMGLDGARLLENLKETKALEALGAPDSIDLEGLLSSIKGDITLGMSEMDIKEGTSDLRLYVQLKSQEPLRALLAQIEREVNASAQDTTEREEDLLSSLLSEPSYTRLDADNAEYHNGLFKIGFSFKDNAFCLSVSAGKLPSGLWQAVEGDDISEQPLVEPTDGKPARFVYNNLATLSSPALMPLLAFVPQEIVTELRKISGVRSQTLSVREQRFELLMVDEKTNALEQLVGISTALGR